MSHRFCLSFGNKIFLAISLISTIFSLLIILWIFSIYKEEIKEEFTNRYTTYGQMIANTFLQLENSSELINKNAILLLDYVIKKSGIPSDVELDRLAKQFGVNAFYIIDKQGKFIRSSDLPIKLQKNSLFSYNQSYKDLIYKNTKIAVTPIIPSYPDDVPAKLTMMPNWNKTLILESSTHLQFISEILQQIIYKDQNIQSIGLYAPTGFELGFISREAGFHQGTRNTATLQTTNIKYSHNLFITTRTPVISKDCIECNVKNVSTNGSYFYNVIIEVSTLELLNRISYIKVRLTLLLLILIFISILISKFLSIKLVSRLSNISQTAKKIMDTKDLDVRIQVKGDDEITYLSQTINQMLSEVKRVQSELIRSERLESFSFVSLQLAHDIRSPLAAMKIIVNNLSVENYKQSCLLLKESIKNINNIADNLLHKYKQSTNKINLNNHIHSPMSGWVNLKDAINEIIYNKKNEWENRKCILVFRDYTSEQQCWVKAESTQIKSIISNLLNNAYESKDYNLKILICLSIKSDVLLLNIQDNGCGIPCDKIDEVMSGLSLKKTGTGFGLSFAKNYIQNINGRLSISSKVNDGTTVSITLPLTSTPPWLPTSVKIKSKACVVIIDDDAQVHKLWRTRLKHCTKLIKHFFSPIEFLKWYEQEKEKDASVTYLIDYDLNNEYNGLDLAKIINSKNNCYLVTNLAESKALQEGAAELGIWLLSKNKIESIEIIIDGS